MKRLMKHRPSPALVIACLALFVSLGGVSYGVATGFIDSREIRNNTIRTQDLRNNDIRGRDIRNSTIRTRDVGFNALTGSDINESRLTKVPDADTLDGIDSSGFVRKGGTPLTPLALGETWSAAPGEAPPSFEIDALGYVHLYGVVRREPGSSDTLFTLPAAARPRSDLHFPLWSSNDTATVGDVQVDGDVLALAAPADEVSLDGVTFRAGG